MILYVEYDDNFVHGVKYHTRVIIQKNSGDTGKKNIQYGMYQYKKLSNSQQKLTIKYKRNYGPTPYLQNIQEGEGTSRRHSGAVYAT
jgi:hypothetical protein